MWYLFQHTYVRDIPYVRDTFIAELCGHKSWSTAAIPYYAELPSIISLMISLLVLQFTFELCNSLEYILSINTVAAFKHFEFEFNEI